MAKKATNYGQTGIIEEVGFFGGEKKPVKKTNKKVTPKKPKGNQNESHKGQSIS